MLAAVDTNSSADSTVLWRCFTRSGLLAEAQGIGRLGLQGKPADIAGLEKSK